MHGMLAATFLCSALTRVTTASANCKAGGGGYALAFDGLEGTVVSRKWDSTALTTLTIEYWLAVMDSHVAEFPVFAYSVSNVDGRYSAGGPPYVSANELATIHRQVEALHCAIQRDGATSISISQPQGNVKLWSRVRRDWANTRTMLTCLSYSFQAIFCMTVTFNYICHIFLNGVNHAV